MIASNSSSFITQATAPASSSCRDLVRGDRRGQADDAHARAPPRARRASPGRRRGRASGSPSARRPAAARATTAGASSPVATLPTTSISLAEPEQQLERLAEGVVVLDQDDADRASAAGLRLLRRQAAARSAAGRPRAPRARARDASPRGSATSPSSGGGSSPVSSVRTPRGSASSASTTARATSSNVLAARDRLAVGEPEPRALPHRDAVQLHVARRDRDGAGRDGVDRLLHRGGVLLGAPRRVEHDHRREPGLQRCASARRAPAATAWATACSAPMITFPLFGSTSTSASSAASIAATRSAVDGFIVRAAVDDHRAEALEQPAVPGARGDGDDPARRPRRGSATACSRRSSRSRGLLVHVRDLDAGDRALRDAERERAARVVGVHVHLQRGRGRRRRAASRRAARARARARPRRGRRPRRRRPCSSGSARAPGGSRRARPPPRRAPAPRAAPRRRAPRRCPRTISTSPAAPASTTPASAARAASRACAARWRRRAATTRGQVRVALARRRPARGSRSASSPRPAS